MPSSISITVAVFYSLCLSLEWWDNILTYVMFCIFLPLSEIPGLSCRQHFNYTFADVPFSRWIKFEEKVEEGGERWSKPHVATLSLHSLFELRTCIEKGSIMLDMEASTLPQVVGK